jgi:hypothetical protein
MDFGISKAQKMLDLNSETLILFRCRIIIILKNHLNRFWDIKSPKNVRFELRDPDLV